MKKAAPKKKAMPKTYEGKSTAPGGGGRFAMLEDKLKKQGVSNPGGLAAAIGRKKYGTGGMAKMAKVGMKRSARGK